MGNQHHAAPGYRMASTILKRGLLGTIHAIHAWTSRPHWPQGIDRPAEQPPVPDYLEWDLWLGPAPQRPYHPAYHPVRWRAWWDFGTGTLGDMAVHLLDPVMTGLELAEPSRIIADVSGRHTETFPASSTVTFYVPRTTAPELSISWYDGGRQPPRDVTGTSRLPPHGVLVVAERGKMFIPELGQMPRFVPASLAAEFASLRDESNEASHMQNFLNACRGQGEPWSTFQYGGRLSRFCLLGNIALFCPGELKWSASEGQFVEAPQANRRLDEPVRPGW
jgi:predicted dehydrogenase